MRMKVFISGTAGFGGKFKKPMLDLPEDVKALIDKHIWAGAEILVGDCIGVDVLVQKYLCSKNYKNVTVYHSGSKFRNCLDLAWRIQSVKVPFGMKGRDFYAVKDKQMAIDADLGIAIWDGQSIGTGNNIANMRNMNKMVAVYRIDKHGFEY